VSSSTPAGPWARLFALNADLLLNTLDGLTAEQGSTPVVPGGNTIAFLFAHLIDSRHFLLGLLGSPISNPVQQALAEASSLAEIGELPAMPGLRDAWVTVSRQLERRLTTCDRTQLDASCSSRLPGSDGTLEGAIAFLAQHDSYHLGQIAMLRRQHGLSAMSYARGAVEREGVVEEGSVE
jgi:uncharacterized damage-inducible protein DinB